MLFQKDRTMKLQHQCEIKKYKVYIANMHVANISFLTINFSKDISIDSKKDKVKC